MNFALINLNTTEIALVHQGANAWGRGTCDKSGAAERVDRVSGNVLIVLPRVCMRVCVVPVMDLYKVIKVP